MVLQRDAPEEERAEGARGDRAQRQRPHRKQQALEQHSAQRCGLDAYRARLEVFAGGIEHAVDRQMVAPSSSRASHQKWFV